MNPTSPIKSFYIQFFFTDSAAVLNLLELRSVWDAEGAWVLSDTLTEYLGELSGQLFLKFSKNKILMGKKNFVPCLDVIMIAFYVRKNIVKDHSSFFGVSTILIASFFFCCLEPKSERKYRTSISDQAHAPWASHNTL